MCCKEIWSCASTKTGRSDTTGEQCQIVLGIQTPGAACFAMAYGTILSILQRHCQHPSRSAEARASQIVMPLVVPPRVPQAQLPPSSTQHAGSACQTMHSVRVCAVLAAFNHSIFCAVRSVSQDGVPSTPMAAHGALHSASLGAGASPRSLPTRRCDLFKTFS